MPVVYAYYDRADMLSTTLDQTEHSHTLCEIMYVVEGNAELLIARTPITLCRRQYVFIDAGVRHRLLLNQSSPFGMMNIEFQYERQDGRCPARTRWHRLRRHWANAGLAHAVSRAVR